MIQKFHAPLNIPILGSYSLYYDPLWSIHVNHHLLNKKASLMRVESLEVGLTLAITENSSGSSPEAMSCHSFFFLPVKVPSCKVGP